MYPFEFWCEQNNRMEFHFERWNSFKEQLFRQYPVNAKPRIQISLHFPSDRLEDVFVHDWNPHHAIGNHHLSVYDCFYNNSDWSMIFDAYPQHSHTSGGDYVLFAEQGHINPWGERIRIMSTASDIYNDSSHRFAYFRGKYWKIISFIKCFGLSFFDQLLLETFRERLIDHPVILFDALAELNDYPYVPIRRVPIPPVEFVDWVREGF